MSIDHNFCRLRIVHKLWWSWDDHEMKMCTKRTMKIKDHHTTKLLKKNGLLAQPGTLWAM